MVGQRHALMVLPLMVLPTRVGKGMGARESNTEGAEEAEIAGVAVPTLGSDFWLPVRAGGDTMAGRCVRARGPIDVRAGAE